MRNDRLQHYKWRHIVWGDWLHAIYTYRKKKAKPVKALCGISNLQVYWLNDNPDLPWCPVCSRELSWMFRNAMEESFG